jgi:hypothetical protein
MDEAGGLDLEAINNNDDKSLLYQYGDRGFPTFLADVLKDQFQMGQVVLDTGMHVQLVAARTGKVDDLVGPLTLYDLFLSVLVRQTREETVNPGSVFSLQEVAEGDSPNMCSKCPRIAFAALERLPDAVEPCDREIRHPATAFRKGGDRVHTVAKGDTTKVYTSRWTEAFCHTGLGRFGERLFGTWGINHDFFCKPGAAADLLEPVLCQALVDEWKSPHGR